MTVVEFWPGAGWYTDIIAPYLAAGGGKLAHKDPAICANVRRNTREIKKTAT